MFQTHILYLDGQEVLYNSRHLFRADGIAQIYRILKEDGSEVTIPYCVVRTARTEIIKEGS